MTTDEIDVIVKGLSYKPGWVFYVRGRALYLHAAHQPNIADGRPHVEIEFCNTIPQAVTTESQLLFFAQYVVYCAEKHEMNEWLKYQGLPLQVPHQQDGRMT